MSIIRETIYNALFALVENAATFKTTSRLLLHWTDVPAELQPALFLTQTKEAAETKRTGIPIIWTFHATIHLYANVGQQADSGQAPSTILNPIVDSICNLLQPPPGIGAGEQTLGGLVTRCRISGEIITDEGLLGPQGVVQIPVIMVVAGNA